MIDLFMLLINCVCVCVSMWVHAIMNMCCPWSLEEDGGSTGAGVKGSCEPSDGSVGNWTWVLCMSSECFWQLSHLFRPSSLSLNPTVIFLMCRFWFSDSLGSGSHTLWASAGTSDSNEWTFWCWSLFSLESPSVSSKGIIHVGKSNLSTLLCPRGEACCGPLWRESLFLSHLPTPTAYDKAS